MGIQSRFEENMSKFIMAAPFMSVDDLVILTHWPLGDFNLILGR